MSAVSNTPSHEDIVRLELIIISCYDPSMTRAATFYAGFADPSEEHGGRLARLECWGNGRTEGN